MDYEPSAGYENDEDLNSDDISNTMDSENVGTSYAPVVILPSTFLLLAIWVLCFSNFEPYTGENQSDSGRKTT